MSAKQSTQWFWSDWAGDVAVRSLTPAERGLWMDLLTLAATGNPTGYVVDARGEPLPLEQIARFANCTLAECSSLIDGILKKGVASRDRSGRLLNRRMVRDLELSVKRRRAGLAGAAATALKWQELNSLTGHLPGHVPRQRRSAPFQERITTTSVGTAREEPAVDNSATASAEPPAGLAGKQSKLAASPELQAILARKYR
jgi:hypothetical protein